MDKEKQRLLVIGKGGREHALLWKLSQSGHVEKLYCAPGNAGTEQIAQHVPIGEEETDKLLAFAYDNNVDFTVVGPEAPLAKGIVNDFNEAGKTIFGPTQEAAQLETSKIWAAGFMKEYEIPSFAYAVPDDYEHARHLANTLPYQYVIKEDGLAAGKGVVVPETREEALKTVETFIDQEKKFFFQERGYGPEISALVISDGERFRRFPPAQDYKRLYGDRGPNTGGMGAYAPVPNDILSLCDKTTIYQHIMRPTIEGMKDKGTPHRGVLYAGIMLTEAGPKVLEFNARFGDPETQALIMLMKNDLYPVLHGSAVGDLSQEHMWFRDGASMCVVYASERYPGKPITGDVISGLDAATDSDLQIFHAGTAKNERGETVTAGGRVVDPTAFGKTLEEAKEKIDSQGIYFRGMQRRYDIGASMIR